MKKDQIQIISCLYCDLEAEAITKCLEMYGCDVIKNRVGCANDFISLVNGTNIYEGTDLIVICAHGNDDLGVSELIASSNNDKPNEFEIVNFQKDNLNGHIPNIPIICLGCWTGNNNFAKVFFANGCSVYIAPDGELDNRDSFVFISDFFYNLFISKLGIKQSFKKASNNHLFKFFEIGREL